MNFSYNEYMYIQFYVHSFLLSLSYLCVCVLYQEKSIAKVIMPRGIVVAYLGLARKQDGGYTRLKTSQSLISLFS